MTLKHNRVIVDGIDLGIVDIYTGITSYDIEMVMEYERAKQSNVTMTIRSQYGTITFQVTEMETKDDITYVYGPLRKMFPGLFVERELSEWQIEYLAEYGLGMKRYRLWNNDRVFTTDQAINFRRGYMRGKGKV